MSNSLTHLQKLPATCAIKHPTDGSTILITRGEAGYRPVPSLNVVAYNRQHNVTAAQIEAMFVGSMFGWNVPGADVERCDGTAFRANV